MSAPQATGVTVFLTGYSGAGKSTIADALIAQLEDEGRPVTVLDGDVVRTHLSSELTFSREHRDLNILRIGWVAGEIVKHGGTVVVAAIAPYEEAREEARALVEDVAARWRGERERAGEKAAARLQSLFRELGLVTRDEWDELELRVAQLEHRLRLLESAASTAADLRGSVPVGD